MHECWHEEPKLRPTFQQINEKLPHIWKLYASEEELQMKRSGSTYMLPKTYSMYSITALNSSPKGSPSASPRSSVPDSIQRPLPPPPPPRRSQPPEQEPEIYNA